MLLYFMFACQADKLSCGEGTVLVGDECVAEDSVDTGATSDSGDQEDTDSAEDSADTGDS